MKICSKAELLKLYDEFSSYFLTTSFLAVNCRDNAIVQLTTFVDDVDKANLLETLSSIEATDLVSAPDILAFSVYLASKFCTPCTCKGMHRGDINARQDTVQFLRDAATFANVHDFILMSISGDFIPYQIAEKKIVFTKSLETSEQMMVMDHWLGKERSGTSMVRNDWDNLVKNAFWNHEDPKRLSTGIAYSLYSQDLQRLFSYLRDVISEVQIFANTRIPRDYTLAQFRDVWSALIALAFNHWMRVVRALKSDAGLLHANKNLTWSKRRWTRVLARLTNHPEPAVSAVLNELTYVDGRFKRPDDSPLPPLVKIQGRLLLLNKVAISALGEEDLYRIIGHSDKKCFEVLKSAKESLQIERLRKLFQATSTEIHSDFDKVKFNGLNSQLDVLFVDRELKIMWCCQLKSIAATRWRKNQQHARDEINRAIEQTITCLGWLETVPQAVLSRLGLTSEALKNFKIRGIVISSGPLGAGLATSRADIPITNEALLRTLIRQIRKPNLDNLWLASKSASVLPIRDIDYKWKNLDFEFADYSFSAENVLTVSHKFF